MNTFNSICFVKYKALIDVWFVGCNSFLRFYFSLEVKMKVSSSKFISNLVFRQELAAILIFHYISECWQHSCVSSRILLEQTPDGQHLGKSSSQRCVCVFGHNITAIIGFLFSEKSLLSYRKVSSKANLSKLGLMQTLD